MFATDANNMGFSESSVAAVPVPVSLYIFFWWARGRFFSRSSICRFLLVAGRKNELSISNDHGLPLAMDPRRRICVTLEVATGVGWEYRIEVDGG